MSSDTPSEKIFSERGDHTKRRKDIAVCRCEMVLPYLKGSVLELGCGVAPLFKAGYDRYSEYTGLDHNEEMVEKHRKKYPKASFRVHNLEYPLPFKDKSFDNIIFFDVLEHIANQDEVMAEISRVLRPGGKLFISTPNKNLCPFSRFNPYHISLLSKKEFLRLLKAHGFWIEKDLSHYSSCSVPILDKVFTPFGEFIKTTVMFVCRKEEEKKTGEQKIGAPE